MKRWMIQKETDWAVNEENINYSFHEYEFPLVSMLRSMMVPGIICVSLGENTYGELKLYKNGQFEGQHMGFQVGYTVRSGGHLVLGQDQDTLGGGFTLEDTLNAQLAEVNMWDRVLSGKEIAFQYTNCRIPSGSVVTWSEFKTLTNGSVIVKH